MLQSKRNFLKTVFMTGCAFGLASRVGAAETATPANTRRIAVVYFSKTGNTRKVAETIRSLTGADLYEVTTKEPYPEEYGPTTEIVKEEIEKGIEREIVAPKMDLSKYDVVILGTPTWWHHVAQALQTWIKSVDLKGKTVAHFNTHGGGGRMHTRLRLGSRGRRPRLAQGDRTSLTAVRKIPAFPDGSFGKADLFSIAKTSFSTSRAFRPDQALPTAALRRARAQNRILPNFP